MNKSLHIYRHTGRRRGFTLVEMLVVAALIAIFAGLAVFNITAQLEREKQKAAIAEARNIATAMSWAYDDLGFFPKIGLLRFNLDNLVEFLNGADFTSMEYHGHAVGNQLGLVNRAWRQNYLSSGGATDKIVKMHYSAGREIILDWPADPWGNPYVAYLVKTIPANTRDNPSNVPKQSFLTRANDKANRFAGVVSYGRNKVPGQTLDRKFDPTPRLGGRLYFQPNAADPKNFTALQPAQYTDQHLSYLLDKSPNLAGEGPYIMETGSDDRFFEF